MCSWSSQNLSKKLDRQFSSPKTRLNRVRGFSNPADFPAHFVEKNNQSSPVRPLPMRIRKCPDSHSICPGGDATRRDARRRRLIVRNEIARFDQVIAPHKHSTLFLHQLSASTTSRTRERLIDLSTYSQVTALLITCFRHEYSRRV
jgi:hypothetical protein